MLGFKNPVAPNGYTMERFSPVAQPTPGSGLVAPNGYTMKSFSPIAQPTPGSGFAILPNKSAAYTSIACNTTLQACIVGLQVIITVCDVYKNPENITTQLDLELLIYQHPTHFLILWDFNANHRM